MNDTEKRAGASEAHLQRVLDEWDDLRRLIELDAFQRAVYSMFRLQPIRVH